MKRYSLSTSSFESHFSRSPDEKKKKAVFDSTTTAAVNQNIIDHWNLFVYKNTIKHNSNIFIYNT